MKLIELLIIEGSLIIVWTSSIICCCKFYIKNHNISYWSLLCIVRTMICITTVFLGSYICKRLYGPSNFTAILFSRNYIGIIMLAVAEALNMNEILKWIDNRTRGKT